MVEAMSYSGTAKNASQFDLEMEELIARFPKIRFTEQAGLMGLRWLKAVQNEDGSWPENKIAMTAMALCAFMADGDNPVWSKEFGGTMIKDAEFLISHLQKDGLFDIRAPENFSHPMATWALFSLFPAAIAAIMALIAYKFPLHK